MCLGSVIDHSSRSFRLIALSLSPSVSVGLWAFVFCVFMPLFLLILKKNLLPLLPSSFFPVLYILCAFVFWVFLGFSLGSSFCFWSGSLSPVLPLSISLLPRPLCPIPSGSAFLASGFIPAIPPPGQRLRAMGSVLRTWMWGMGCQVYLNPRWTQRQVRLERPGPPVLYGDLGRRTLLSLLWLPGQQWGVSSAYVPGRPSPMTNGGPQERAAELSRAGTAISLSFTGVGQGRRARVYSLHPGP